MLSGRRRPSLAAFAASPSASARSSPSRRSALPAALLLLALLLAALRPAQTCVIQGTESGYCLPIDASLKAFMPFCYPLLYTGAHPGDKRMYSACVPKPVPYPHLTPQWKNHTITYKDMWVKNRYLAMAQFRKYAEWNYTATESQLTEEGVAQIYPNRGEIAKRFFPEKADLQGGPQIDAPVFGSLLDPDEEWGATGPGSGDDGRCGPDSRDSYPCGDVEREPWNEVNEACCQYEPSFEYGELESSAMLFENACMRAYKNLLCYTNFPRCSEEGESLTMCQSTCQNFFDACGFKGDMHRCGPTKYLNGNGFENPDGNPIETEGALEGRKVFRRSFMPGQPWYVRPAEEYGSVDAEVEGGITMYVDALTCTPSILNAAPLPGARRGAGAAAQAVALAALALTGASALTL